MTDYLFEKEIRIFGLKRSGKSSCADYIWNHFPRDSRMHLPNTGLTFNQRYREPIEKTIRKIAKLKNRKCCINSVEHLDLLAIALKLKDENSKYNQGKKEILNYFKKDKFAKDIYDVLVLRSYHNNLADLFRLRSMHYAISSFWALWAVYAKEYIGEFNYLKNKILFDYDSWNLSRDYRIEFSRRLGLDYNYFDQWNRQQEFYEEGKREIYTNKRKIREGEAFGGWEKYIKDDYPHKDCFIRLVSDPGINSRMRTIYGIDMKKTMGLN